MAENIASLASRLESLCKRILEANGYHIVSAKGARLEHQADIIALEARNKQQIVIEVKLYRSPKVDRSVLRNAAAQVIRLKNSYGAKGMIVVTVPLDQADLKLLRHIGVDEVWDISEIRKHANVDIALSTELERLFRDAELQYANLPTVPLAESADQSSLQLDEQNGEKLIQQLQRTTAGTADARKFEGLCCECIQYLFGEHFGQLQPQKRVEHGFQCMDLIARLTPSETGSFWLSLANDFRCRYVVFEFKNYGPKISQNQIYTTEKYLYPNALRPVAIIVARSGYDSGAERAVQGALRESGKVILVLSLEHLFRLLRAKDRGLEPSDLLIDHLDNLLTTIAP